MPKVVLLLGAGATVSDVATRSKIARPPLDKEFFALSRAAGRRTAVDTIVGYMQRTYAVNILNGSDDSLEQVMGQIYTDQLNPTLAADARPAFFAPLRLFNERLATTTNNIAATQKRFLYRVLSYYLAEGVTPSDLTMVTFNQDLQAEKILQLLASKAKWRKFSPQLFNFPHCYELGVPTARVTSPAGGSVDEIFDEHTPDDERVRVLKLHGSLNWYSTHNSRTPSPRALFNQLRLLSITRRRAIYVDMTISGPLPRLA